MVYDVAIVGFGPVGAALAGLLGRRGLNVVVVERDQALFPHPRAAHIDHTGLRTVQELGCLDAALTGMIRNRSLDLVNANHDILVRIPADQPGNANLPLSMYFYQPAFDALLRGSAANWPGVEVRLGTELVGLDRQVASVRLHVRGTDGAPGTLEAGWVVGCDGSWSLVRENMGLSLENLQFDEKWLVLDLRLTAGHGRLPTDRVIQVCDPARPHLSTPISADRQRFEFMLLPGENGDAMRQPDVVGRLLEPWLLPGGYEIDRSAVYTFHGLVAQSWCRGRTLIAGDAAHQMPPFLGQGMCSGLRDAANLAWKLDLVVRGGAPDTLLDTYAAERSPHVREVIEAAIAFGRVVCETDPDRARERDASFLSRDKGASGRLSFRLPRLHAGPLVVEGGGALFPQPVLGGRRMDDVVGQRFLVLGRDGVVPGETTAWWRTVMGAHIASPEEARHPALAGWLDRHRVHVAVVRPDRYVLGAGAALDPITEAVATLLAPAAALPTASFVQA